MMKQFKRVDDLKAQVDVLRPLPEHTVKSLHEALVLEWTYHSNAIEGNTLTLMETKVVLDGITIGGKSMREHFEAINHREAIFYVEGLLKDEEVLGEPQIKSLHQLVLKNIDDQNAGAYRQQNVVISGASHTPVDHLHVPAAMKDLLVCCQSFSGHPVERAARLHADFVKIHPFVDGNGRTGRLLLNLELMRSGYLPVIIKAENRLAYYQALDAAGAKQNYADFIAQVVALSEARFELVLSLVAGTG